MTAAKAKGPTPRNHRHACVECAHEWVCMLLLSKTVEEKKTCPVEDAAAINKQGPVCELCRHIEMAKRVAGLRGLRLVVLKEET